MSKLRFSLDPPGHRCCRAAPDSRAAAPQVCSCLSLPGDGRMRAGKRLTLAGGPESGSSYVADIEAAPGDVAPQQRLCEWLLSPCLPRLQPFLRAKTRHQESSR